MTYFAGLDVSMEETWLCVVDESGSVRLDRAVASDPQAIASALRQADLSGAKLGLEVGALSPWLYHELTALGFAVVCFEARQVSQILKSQRNKTDRQDAFGLAQILRGGWYRAVHVKSYDAHALRALLKARAMLVKTRQDLENQLRGLLKPFGIRLKRGGRQDLAQRIEAACGKLPELWSGCRALLKARQAVCGQLAALDGKLGRMARRDEACRRLMTVPGVGPITALAFVAHLDAPGRFQKARAMGPCLGLTPRRNQSGETDYQGRISKRGDKMLRSLLYEAANVLLSVVKAFSSLKAWGLKLAKRIGFKKARIAVARKLAVIMTAIVKDGTEFCWTSEKAPVA